MIQVQTAAHAESACLQTARRRLSASGTFAAATAVDPEADVEKLQG